MILTPLYLISVAGSGGLVFFIWLYTRNWWRLPPGIRGIRFLLEIPNEKPWLKWLEFNRRHGDLASMSVLGYYVISIGSAKIAEDLLEKRSTNYSDRPRSVMCGELSGWGKVMLFSNYNAWFRAHRKWLAQEIGSYATVTKLHCMIELETRRYLRSVLEDPAKAQAHVRKNLTSIHSPPLPWLSHTANSQLSIATLPGAYYVDLVPLMKYIPSWLPFAGFRRKAKQYAAVLQDMVEIPHNYVKSQLAAGTALPSLASRILSRPDLTDELEDSVKWATATMYQGGADTANSVAYAFYLAMTLLPARCEESAGRTGLSSLRYTREDDEYNGYLIPAGSYVFVNIWAILRDERTYTKPLEFRPERFLGDNPEPRPGNVCFGLGRRRCPGYFLGHSSVWLMCAQVLAAFDISKAVENGVEITPEHDLVGETIVHQAPFKCSIKSRSPEAEDLIRQEVTSSGLES
ncbi:cytochrome P450 [Melanogaster broomeanus]|nr:cytochrome P450 [Melanogaster broomeanus]